MSRIQEEEEEEEERGPQTLLRPSTRFPPSISERLRNRHCRSPRGDREGVYLMQPSSKLERRMGCRVDRVDPYNLPTTDKGKGMRTAYRTSEDGENTKKGETGGGGSGELEVRKPRNLQKMATVGPRSEPITENAKRGLAEIVEDGGNILQPQPPESGTLRRN